MENIRELKKDIRALRIEAVILYLTFFLIILLPPVTGIVLILYVNYWWASLLLLIFPTTWVATEWVIDKEDRMNTAISNLEEQLEKEMQKVEPKLNYRNRVYVAEAVARAKKNDTDYRFTKDTKEHLDKMIDSVNTFYKEEAKNENGCLGKNKRLMLDIITCLSGGVIGGYTDKELVALLREWLGNTEAVDNEQERK